MGHNRAGERRKAKKKATMKEKRRLWDGSKPDPNPVAPFDLKRGTTHVLPSHQLCLDERTMKSASHLGNKYLRRQIKKYGCSPIMVARMGDNKFRVVEGEKRLKACLQLGYTRIPCYIMQMPNLVQSLLLKQKFEKTF